MFCKKCGNEIPETALFCKNCGEKVMQKPSADPPKPVENAGKNKTLVISLVALIAVFLLVLAGFGVKLLLNRGDNEVASSQMPEPTLQPAPTASVERKNIEAVITAVIRAQNAEGNISAAVLDNNTGEAYYVNADAAHSAWGFYLPVYLAYSDSPSSKDARLLENVMSLDAATCNEAGNTIIQNMGGPSGITAFLRSTYGVSATSYGRYFADVRAASDNYTTAAEALRFLEIISHRGACEKLSYDISKFGIRAPYGATVYAQVGTENNQVRKNVNIFAVVQGTKSNYCVAVLTQNGAGTAITGLLEAIHGEMEG